MYGREHPGPGPQSSSTPVCRPSHARDRRTLLSGSELAAASLEACLKLGSGQGEAGATETGPREAGS